MKRHFRKSGVGATNRGGRITSLMKRGDAKVLKAAAALAVAVQSSAEWREMAAARGAMQRDSRFAGLLKRRGELLRAQRRALAGGGGFGGSELVDMIALWREIENHELHVRQQRAWDALLRLLRGINQVISEGLGMDFASNAGARQVGGLCRRRFRSRKPVRTERIIT